MLPLSDFIVSSNVNINRKDVHVRMVSINGKE